MIDLSTVKAITIPEGVVKKIVSAGVTLWQAVTYKNWVKFSIDTDGSIFNGTGWIAQKRVSSSGSLKDVSYGATTGFIPVKAGDVVRFHAGEFDRWDAIAVYNCVSYFDSTFSILGSFTTQPNYYGMCSAQNSIVEVDDRNIKTLVVPDNSSIAYIRLSIGGNYSDARHGADIVITVNEEIV